MARLTMIPAYGRDYKSKAEVLADWDANKDFEAVGFVGSGMINKEDCPVSDHNIRYARQIKVMTITKGAN